MYEEEVFGIKMIYLLRRYDVLPLAKIKGLRHIIMPSVSLRRESAYLCVHTTLYCYSALYKL